MPDSTQELHSSPLDLSLLLEGAKKLARKAGCAIKTIYDNGDYTEYTKDDESPVTSADYAANEVLVKGLQELAPDIPIVSEESPIKELTVRGNWQRYWLLDPLDGTQEFISRSGDFAVNIALVENGWPVLGIIYSPIQNKLYYAQKSKGAFRECVKGVRELQVKKKPGELRVVISRVQTLDTVTRHFNDSQLNKVTFHKLGSCSLKNCFVAEGKADCYLRVGPTGEWDTGASQVILEEAGGQLLDAEFNALSYNRRETLNNPDFMALGHPDLNWSEIIIPHKTERKL